MKLSELAASLRKEYSHARNFGVERIKEYPNIWFIVPPPPPVKLPRNLPAGALSKANRVIETLPRHDRLSDLDRLVSYLFTKREATESSRMEGTWSTIDHVLTPGDLYDRKEKSERTSVLGYAHALEDEVKSAWNKGIRIFNLALVSRVHSMIMRKDPSFKGHPGTIRAPDKPGKIVFIGGLHRKEDSTYNPAPARHVARCLKEFLSWLSNEELRELGDAGMGLPLVVRMAVGHSHFEAIHPFPDGNGRVGRLLLALQMGCHGVLPVLLSGYIEAEKKDYAIALSAAQKKLNYGPIVEFFSSALVSSHEEAEETKNIIMKLPDRWQAKGQFREKSTARNALPFLVSNPVFTTKGLQKALKVSLPAANNAAALLCKAGIVRERTGHGRNRVFAAEEVIELLSRPFRSNSTLALERASDLLAKKR